VNLARSAAKARPANPRIREEKLLIYKVEEMAIAAGLPTPKVYVQDSENINAFATGKKPEDSVICITSGALKKLKTDEKKKQFIIKIHNLKAVFKGEITQKIINEQKK